MAAKKGLLSYVCVVDIALHTTPILLFLVAAVFLRFFITFMNLYYVGEQKIVRPVS